MPQNADPIGVKAYWDNADFIRGFRDYNNALEKANQAGRQFADQLEKSGKESASAFQSSSKSYIQSGKDIQAMFQETSRLAAQFGGTLRNAAAGTAIKQSFQSLARASGVNADKLIANMQRASKGTVAEVDLIRSANRALLAGGADIANELPRLLEIARAASIATGQDIGYVFETLTKGVIKASPLLIDNAEVYIKVGHAVDEYAARMGKSTDELSQQQRQLAVLNAVLAEGDEFIRSTGTDLETATDAYDRWAATTKDATQATTAFINDALGPLGPALKGIADLLIQLAPLMTTIALLSGTGKMAGLAASLKGLATGPVAVGAGALALGGVAGYALYEQGIRKLDSSLKPLNETVDKGSKLIGYWAQQALSGKDAADEWMRAQLGMPTLAQQLADSQAEHNAALAEFVATAGAGSDAYAEYLDLVGQINSELVEGEAAVRLLTRAEFEFQQVVEQGNATLERQREVLAALYREQIEAGETLAAFGTKARMAALGVQEEVTALVDEREALRQSNVDRARTIEQMEEMRAKMDEARTNVADILSKQNEAIQKAEADHQQKMADIAEKGAQARAEAERDLERSLLDAERERSRALEDAARAHAMAVQDIERRHRERLDEIEHDYQKTVAEASIERDALAILQARERRQEEIDDANQDRDRSLEDEGRNFQERQRQIEQSYQDQVLAAQQAYAQRMRDLDQQLAEETRKEREAQRQRLEDARVAHENELALAEVYWRRYESGYRRHLANLRQIRGGTGREGGLMGGLGGGIGMQHGFEGIVTGPQTFHVEPGVQEFVYASGDLGRQQVLPSAGANQAATMRALVGGSVGVGLSGFSEGLLSRIGPALQESVAQGVLDELAEAFERAVY